MRVTIETDGQAPVGVDRVLVAFHAPPAHLVVSCRRRSLGGLAATLLMVAERGLDATEVVLRDVCVED